VVLFDFDFRAPSLHTLFGVEGEVKFWLNDWLEQRCEVSEALVDLSGRFGTKGSFQVGFTNPSGQAIGEMTRRSLDEEWQARVLKLLLDAKDLLFEQHSVHFQIFDTSPGFALSSINAIVVSDRLILVLKMDQLDLEGTRQFISGIYNRILGKQPELCLNKVPARFLESEQGRRRLVEEVERSLGVKVASVIPCFCGVLESMGRVLFADQYPDHPFTHHIEKLAGHLEGRMS